MKIKCCDMFPALKAFHKKFISVYETNVLCNKLYLSSLSQKINNNKILNQKPVHKLQ